MNFRHNKIWWYPDHVLCEKCNTFAEKIVPFNDSHLNKHLFDFFTLWHIIGGIFLGLVFKRLDYVLIGNFLFEFIENTYIGVDFWIKSGISNNQEYDTYLNILGDSIGVLIGYYVSKKGLQVSLYVAILALVLFFTLPFFFEKSESKKQIRNML